MATIAKPKALEMPSRSTALGPDPMLPTTAAPQPKNTRANVPINSANCLFISFSLDCRPIRRGRRTPSAAPQRSKNRSASGTARAAPSAVRAERSTALSLHHFGCKAAPPPPARPDCAISTQCRSRFPPRVLRRRTASGRRLQPTPTAAASRSSPTASLRRSPKLVAAALRVQEISHGVI